MCGQSGYALVLAVLGDHAVTKQMLRKLYLRYKTKITRRSSGYLKPVRRLVGDRRASAHCTCAVCEGTSDDLWKPISRLVSNHIPNLDIIGPALPEIQKVGVH